jgi:hypothetical protein
MSLFYRLAADFTVIVHAGYVSYVVLGQLLILIGILCRWSWVRNPWFRWTHLAAILIVVFEALYGIVCPLTTLENELRRRAGQTGYQGDFIANLVHDMLFFDFAPWVFTVIYAAFGLLVLLTFVLAPPRRRGSNQSAPP